MPDFSKLSSARDDAPHRYLSPRQAEHKHLFPLQRARWFKQVYRSYNKEDASNKAALQIYRCQCVAQTLCTNDRWDQGIQSMLVDLCSPLGKVWSSVLCLHNHVRQRCCLYIPEKKKRWLKVSCCFAHLSAESIKQSIRLTGLASPEVAISTPCIPPLSDIRVQHALYYSLHFHAATVWFTSHAVTIKLSICSL